ncbi:hypothetical protein CCY86_01850 [Ralstonia solanacearum]|nr:hypothetical protein CCY86_01850 [Ralstonia solanacearum]
MRTVLLDGSDHSRCWLDGISAGLSGGMEQDVAQPITSLGAFQSLKTSTPTFFALTTPIATMTGQGAFVDVVDGSANPLLRRTLAGLVLQFCSQPVCLVSVTTIFALNHGTTA